MRVVPREYHMNEIPSRNAVTVFRGVFVVLEKPFAFSWKCSGTGCQSIPNTFRKEKQPWIL
ncbi:hypothetical protein D4758_08490 [Enterocloster citroniae]|nr:hypothetical protein [Enterocloster citroniae]RGC10732.1 hypothetical protein DWZ14_11015 [Enterocloster citroniae]